MFPRVLRSMLLRSRARLAPSIRPVSTAFARSHRPYKACLIGAIHLPLPSSPFISLRTMTMTQRAGPEAAHKLLDFVNASPTPFHAVRAASARLEKAGFQKVRECQRVGVQQTTHDGSCQIREEDDWEKSLKAGGRYYFTRYVAVYQLV